MALEDLTTKPAQASSAAEDEDLFDFPVIEMTLEGTRTVERRTVADASAAAPRASASTGPAAPIPHAAPASAAPHATSTLTSAAPAPAKPSLTGVHGERSARAIRSRARRDSRAGRGERREGESESARRLAGRRSDRRPRDRARRTH